MSLLQSLTATHVIESMHNYAQADDPLHNPIHPPSEGGLPSFKSHPFHYGWNEESFWKVAATSPSNALNTALTIDHMCLSDWVARVPGLYWQPESLRLRDSVSNAKKLIGGYAYDPYTRSVRVMGGVGTLRLLPGEDGARLATIGRSGDVAAGVPVLIPAKVWDRIQEGDSCEGRLISGEARWVPMSMQWATYFPVIRGIPRGYLSLIDPDHVTIHDARAQTYIAPFSIMEYASGASELFDYVYVGVRTDEKDYRQQVADFFDHYHKDVSPFARYLIAADMVQPMWEAAFDSPAQLRSLDAGAKSQLSLLEARVRERMLGIQVIEPLLDKLGETIQEQADLRVLSDEIELKTALWLAGGNLAERISQFVDAVLQCGKLEELIVRLAARYPLWFTETGKEGTSWLP